MDATALLSGGKDSVFSAYLAECQGFRLQELLTIEPQDPESMMFHTPNLHLVRLQAEAWGRPHRRVALTGGGEAAESRALEAALREAPGEWIVAGAIASSYQFARLLRLADRLGRRVYAPLWGKDGLTVVRAEATSGLDIRFVHLAAEGLPPQWIGTRLAPELLGELAERTRPPHGFHPAGEGGEYETVVVDAPFFSSRIEFDDVEVVHGRGTVALKVHEAHLGPKPVRPGER